MGIVSDVCNALDCDARFNTYWFLFLFLPTVLLVYWLLPKNRWRHTWLLVTSLVFYSAWDWRFTPILLLGGFIDFFIALRIPGSDRAKVWMWISVVVNLGLLGFFKYTIFAAETLEPVFALMGLDVVVPYGRIILPVGISFYTFQTMSYTIDVYRGTIQPTRNVVHYLSFVSLFSQLVAGPIVRFAEISKQMTDTPRWPNQAQFVIGISLFAVGLFKKVVVADTIALKVDPIWSASAIGTLDAWVASIGYSLQLYFDFSGYSDMAIGIGAMLALRFPINFHAPYHAKDPSEFWRRWHMSLSTFLRDYLYIPLGGNRKGPNRTASNLMIVMVLGGLWHGAAWTFILWGAYHGTLLLLYHYNQRPWNRLPRGVRQPTWMLLVVIGWVMFRATSVSQIGTVLGAMFTPATSLLTNTTDLLWLLFALAFTMTMPVFLDFKYKRTWWMGLMVGAMMAVSIVFMSRGNSPFLYYQF